jgi:uncharacterized protein YkwD
VIVALLLVALGISWLPWRDLVKLVPSRAGESTRPPTVIDATAAPSGSAPPVSPSPSPASSGQLSAADKAAVTAVVALVNAERARARCAAVKVDERLAKAAAAHSADMARRSYFNHNSPEGTDPWQRAAAAGYTRPTGENIALGYTEPKALMDGWMKSSGHRANIVNCKARAVGIGLARKADGTPYWTQLFGAA